MSKVLVADDEPRVRQLARAILERSGHQVLEAEDGAIAYALIQQLGGTLDLVITDIRMPNMTGTELVNRVRREHPRVGIVCMSAYADEMPKPLPPFVAKPFTPASLSAKVNEALRKSASDDDLLVRERLQRELASAKAKLDLANEESKRLEAMIADVGAMSPDGGFAFRQALRQQKAALREYRLALQKLRKDS
jgi:CheY-like chemotaxis protein